MIRLLTVLLLIVVASAAFATSYSCLVFASETQAVAWIETLEARWPHQPGWRYGDPMPLKDGRWVVRIVDSARQHMTAEEIAALVEVDDSDILRPAPPEIP